MNNSQLQSPAVPAISLKLPEFWSKSPDVWFARVEAQFNTTGITQDHTKYDYVVSTLDVNTADEVQSILLNPPHAGKFETLKAALIKTFGKSQVQKGAELLSLSGLGDKRPTALLRKINALHDDPTTLKRALFLSNLPADVRSILAGHDISDMEDLAEAADRIWESRVTGSQMSQVSRDTSPPVSLPPQEPTEAVSTVQRRRASNQRAQKQSSICFYHQKFGPDARRCQPDCKFSSLLSKKSLPSSSFPGNAMAGR